MHAVRNACMHRLHAAKPCGPAACMHAHILQAFTLRIAIALALSATSSPMHVALCMFVCVHMHAVVGAEGSSVQLLPESEDTSTYQCDESHEPQHVFFEMCASPLPQPGTNTTYMMLVQVQTHTHTQRWQDLAHRLQPPCTARCYKCGNLINVCVCVSLCVFVCMCVCVCVCVRVCRLT